MNQYYNKTIPQEKIILEKSQLFKHLQDSLLSILENPAFARTKPNWSDHDMGTTEDKIINYNLIAAEEILGRDQSEINGTLKDDDINDFEKQISVYMEENGTGNREYDKYITIIYEYLVLIIQKPLHPRDIRQLKSKPPEDTDNLCHCTLKPYHIKDNSSLCRLCSSRAWPEIEGKKAG